jgi:hypothetical protein
LSRQGLDRGSNATRLEWENLSESLNDAFSCIFTINVDGKYVRESIIIDAGAFVLMQNPGRGES